MWVIVIKEVDSPKPAIVLRRKTLRSAIDYMQRMSHVRLMINWTEPMLTMLTVNYRKLSASTIAAQLSAMTGQTVTKNAVISKANAIGLGRRRSRPRTEGI